MKEQNKKAIYTLIGLAIVGILINSFFIFNFYNPGVIQEKISTHNENNLATSTQEQALTDNSQVQIIENNNKNSNHNSARKLESLAYSTIDYSTQTNSASENQPPSTVIPPTGVVDSADIITEILPSEESAAPM